MGAKPFDPKDFETHMSPEGKKLYRRAVNEQMIEDGKEPLFKD
jgi:hypothetical protein